MYTDVHTGLGLLDSKQFITLQRLLYYNIGVHGRCIIGNAPLGKKRKIYSRVVFAFRLRDSHNLMIRSGRSDALMEKRVY